MSINMTGVAYWHNFVKCVGLTPSFCLYLTMKGYSRKTVATVMVVICEAEIEMFADPESCFF